MKVIHKNSREVISTTEPHYYKIFGVYGYLVVIDKRVFFIESSSFSFNDVTDGFEFIL